MIFLQWNIILLPFLLEKNINQRQVLLWSQKSSCTRVQKIIISCAISSTLKIAIVPQNSNEENNSKHFLQLKLLGLKWARTPWRHPYIPNLRPKNNSPSGLLRCPGIRLMNTSKIRKIIDHFLPMLKIAKVWWAKWSLLNFSQVQNMADTK